MLQWDRMRDSACGPAHQDKSLFQTGVHLVLTPKIMNIVFNQLSNIFEAKNTAEALNQSISDIGKNWIDG